jgi:L-iditol 2-dehydrogenase
MSAQASMWAMKLAAPFRMVRTTAARPATSAVPEGQVMLRLTAGGICGTDLAFYRGTPNTWSDDPQSPPGFPMHEVAGEVVASRCDHIDVGDQVVGWATSMAGFTEYVVTDGASVHAYSQGLHPTQAIMLQPLACVLSAVEHLGDLRGAHCAVLGQGPIGVLFSHVLKNAGAGRVTGVDRIGRSASPGDYGVDDSVLDSAAGWAATLKEHDRPSVVVEAIGHQVGTLGDAVDAVAMNGRVLYFGIPDDTVYPLNMVQVVRKGLTLCSCTTTERTRVLAAADEYLAEHPYLVGLYISHILGLDDADKAFGMACAPAPGLMKVVIDAAN